MIGGTLILWNSKKLGMLTLSSCEIEYIAISYVVWQALLMENVVRRTKDHWNIKDQDVCW